MRNPSEPMIPNMSAAVEYEALEGLVQECNQFLDKWKAHLPNQSSATPDAIVAIMSIQLQCVQRRSYILGLTHQEELPF